MAYKPNVGGVRESPARHPRAAHPPRGGGQLHDPYVASLATAPETLRSVPDRSALAESADCYVVCTNARCFDYDAIVKGASLIVDHSQRAEETHEPVIFRLVTAKDRPSRRDHGGAGGIKGIPGKNTKRLAGKPLIRLHHRQRAGLRCVRSPDPLDRRWRGSAGAQELGVRGAVHAPAGAVRR
jgi:hypothetical protein